FGDLPENDQALCPPKVTYQTELFHTPHQKRTGLRPLPAPRTELPEPYSCPHLIRQSQNPRLRRFPDPSEERYRLSATMRNDKGMFRDLRTYNSALSHLHEYKLKIFINRTAELYPQLCIPAAQLGPTLSRGY